MYLKFPIVLFLFVAATVFSTSAQDNPFATQSQAAILEVLQSDADTFTKAKACQRLAIIGDEGCTDALVDLLGDSKLGVYALTALQRIPGDRVDAALLFALQAHEGRSRVGIIHAIGQRKIETAEYQLVRLCKSDTASAEEKQAAIRALGSLGKVDQVTAMKGDSELEKRIAEDAILRTRVELNRGIEQDPSEVSDDDFLEALATLHLEASRAAVSKSLIQSIGELSPTRQILAMSALAEVDVASISGGDTALLQPIAKLVESENVEVATAAVLLLGTRGYYSQSTALPGWLDDRADLARVALPLLSQANNDALDRDVVARLSKVESAISDDQVLGLIEYAAQRRLSTATPELLLLAGGAKQEVAAAAIRAAGYTASVDQFGSLLDLLVKKSGVSFDQTDVDLCMSRACVRLPRDQAAAVIENKLQSVSDESKQWLIGSLAQLGGKEALAVVTRAAGSGDQTLVDGATRALGEWLSADVAVPLRDLVETLPKGNYRTRALRAYLRVGRQFDMSRDERMELCRRGLQLAERDDERVLVVDILLRNPSLDAAELLAEISRAQAGVKEQALRNRAMMALSKVAESVAESDPEGMRAILRQVDIDSASAEVREKLRGFAE